MFIKRRGSSRVARMNTKPRNCAGWKGPGEMAHGRDEIIRPAHGRVRIEFLAPAAFIINHEFSGRREPLTEHGTQIESCSFEFARGTHVRNDTRSITFFLFLLLQPHVSFRP